MNQSKNISYLRKIYVQFKPWLILLISVGIVLLIFLTKPTTEPQAQIETSWPITATSLQKQSYQPNTMVYGKVVPLSSTTLRAGVTGYIQSIPAQEGLVFLQNDILATIDPIDAQLKVDERTQTVKKLQALLQAEHNKFAFDQIILQKQQILIDLSTKGVERQQQLAKQNVASKANIESAQLELFKELIALQDRQLTVQNYPERIKQLEADLLNAKTLLQQAELDLSRTVLIAPFNGRISQRFVSVGDRVQVNQEILTLYDIDTLEVRAQLPTKELIHLQNILQNQQALEATILNNMRPFTLKLDRLSGEITTNQAGIEAIFKISELNSALRIGQIVKLLIRYPAIENVFAVPFSALYDIDIGYLIYKIIDTEDTQRLYPIQVDIKGDHFLPNGDKFVLVSSNQLQANDLILITHLPNARDDLKVEIRETK